MVASVFAVLVVALTASLTRLATTDEITAPLRVKIREKWGIHSFPARMLECDRCAGFWVALPVNLTILAIAASTNIIPGWLAALAWIPSSLATSYLAFLLILRGEA